MTAPTRIVHHARASWLLSRRSGIGASEVSAILGLNPWRSAFEVWASKVGPIGACDHPVPCAAGPGGVNVLMGCQHGTALAAFEQAQGVDLGEPARWGVLLEDAVRLEAARRIGRRIFIPGKESPEQYVTFSSPDLAAGGVPLFVTPDGQIDRAYVPEIGFLMEQGQPGQPFEAVQGCPATVPYPNSMGSPHAMMGCLRPACHPSRSGSGSSPGAVYPHLGPAATAPDVALAAGHVFDLVDPRGPGLYEGKVAGLFVSREEWADEGPAMHLIQIQAGLAVLGWKWGLLAGLIGGQRLVLHEVERDDGFIAWMLDELRRFWVLVQARRPPAPDSSESARDALASYYSRGIDGKTVELPPMAKLWVEQRAAGKEAIKRGEQLVRESENLLKGALGDATVGLLPGSDSGISWPVVSPKAPVCPHCHAAIREAGTHRRMGTFSGGARPRPRAEPGE